ncbi:MAG: hypothetical protein ABIJ59_03530 [Pseudomonadota bacterium]
MINDLKTFELLSELSKLSKKYGKETFIELATILRDPSLLSQVADSLEAIANMPSKKKGTQKRISPTEERLRFRESLIELGKSEIEKSKILLPLFDSLQNKNLLPSLRELINFISDHGLPVPKAKSRSKVIISFMKSCKNLPLSDLQQFNFVIEPHQTTDDEDRSLEGWGNIILDRNK